MCSTLGVSVPIAPGSQVTVSVGSSYVAPPSLLWYVYPAGITSRICMLAAVARSGPELVTAIVNTTVSPPLNPPLLSASPPSARVTDLVTLRSEINGVAVASSSCVVELSPGVLSGSSELEASTWEELR